MNDNITLPRRHIDYAADALEHLIKNYNGSESFEVLVSEIIHHLRTALAAEQPKPEPVAAQHRFRFPRSSTLWARKIGSPDWGRWHECKVANRPAWEIDSQGWEVQYRPLYTAPPDIEALRREDEP